MGGQDHTVTLAGARRLAKRIGSGPAELLLLPQSYHLVGVDVERERCAEAVVRFLASLGPQPAAPDDGPDEPPVPEEPEGAEPASPVSWRR
jgi:carboxylesterase